MKKGPIIIIALLISLLLFIGGMQYGKRVETADKAIALLLSITPDPEIITVVPQSYSRISHKECGITYMLPDYAQKQENAVIIKCQEGFATPSAQLDTKTSVELFIDNPTTKEKIYIQAAKEIAPLIKETVSFVE